MLMELRACKFYCHIALQGFLLWYCHGSLRISEALAAWTEQAHERTEGKGTTWGFCWLRGHRAPPERKRRGPCFHKHCAMTLQSESPLIFLPTVSCYIALSLFYRWENWYSKKGLWFKWICLCENLILFLLHNGVSNFFLKVLLTWALSRLT